jgi:hypothetical protein
VHLIDAQEKQLVDGVKYIDGLRAASQNPERSWGEVKTFTPDELQSALQDSWLVVEVRVPNVILQQRTDLLN